MSYTGKFEIVSLTGTLSAGGSHHLHVAIADSTGAVFGGHLLAGCVVRTTAEIVLVRRPCSPPAHPHASTLPPAPLCATHTTTETRRDRQ